MQISWGYAPPLILEAAVKHGVFDRLDGGPKTIQQLVRETGASLRGLSAVCNALIGLGFLARTGNRYKLTPESAAFLVSGKPGYHGAFLRHISRQLMPQWLGLDTIVKTGRPAKSVNQEKGGAEFFAEFVEAIFPLSHGAANALGEHLKLARATRPVRVLDIAAGSGVWGLTLAAQSKQVQVTAVDWPEVLPVTKKVATRLGVADRLSTLPGDLATVDFGKNHEVATLGHILHSEGAERSRRLLTKVFHSLAQVGTIAVMEFLVNDQRTAPPVSLLFAVNMLVNTEAGDTFSFAEISKWLRAAGFVKPRLLPVPAVSPLILATKP